MVVGLEQHRKSRGKKKGRVMTSNSRKTDSLGERLFYHRPIDGFIGDSEAYEQEEEPNCIRSHTFALSTDGSILGRRCPLSQHNAPLLINLDGRPQSVHFEKCDSMVLVKYPVQFVWFFVRAIADQQYPVLFLVDSSDR